MCSFELPFWRSILGNLDQKRKKETWCPPPPRKLGDKFWGDGGGAVKLGFEWGASPYEGAYIKAIK